MADTFHGVLAFAFMASLILVGVVLRAKIPWLQASLIPASLIGGLLGFVLLATGMAGNFASEDFVSFAFHFFTLSFMSLVLTGKEPGATGSGIRAGGMWLSVGWVMSLSLQALVGLTVILVYNAATGAEISRYLGLLVTHGFTQGPGQALAMGSIWEGSFAVEHAVSFGLIYASIGFIVSFMAGVPAARFAIARGLNSNLAARLDAEFLKGLHDPASRPSSGRQVTHSANVDSLVYHLGIVGAAYLLTD
ncbi:MAG: sodium/glutamate symporter, partial [Pseudomonadales bacterium]